MSIYSGVYGIYEKLASAKLNLMVSYINSHLHDGSTGTKISLTSAISGTLPTANGGTNSTANANAANGVVVLNASAKLPAVDGSQLIGIVSVPTGAMTMWSGALASPPEGWLVCDGSTVSQTTYADLYAVIGTIYGSNAGGNFTLPNFSNAFPYGANEGSSAGNASVGSKGVSATYTLSGNDNSVALTADAGGTHDGGGGAGVWQGSRDLMPPYIAVGFIIKT